MLPLPLFVLCAPTGPSIPSLPLRAFFLRHHREQKPATFKHFNERFAMAFNTAPGSRSRSMTAPKTPSPCSTASHAEGVVCHPRVWSARSVTSGQNADKRPSALCQSFLSKPWSSHAQWAFVTRGTPAFRAHATTALDPSPPKQLPLCDPDAPPRTNTGNSR